MPEPVMPDPVVPGPVVPGPVVPEPVAPGPVVPEPVVPEPVVSEPSTSRTMPEPIPVPAAIAERVESPADEHRDFVVVLVDDEAEVAEVVGDELRASRVLVRSASNPKEAVALVREHSEAGERVVVITDLRMPTSTGRSFYGGFELVRRLKKNGFNPPVLLMTERLSEKARARAMELGITKVAFKPSISKLDPEEYKTDLRGFASLLMRATHGFHRDFARHR